MPPKETAKERKEREKAEAQAQAQFAERRQFEISEERDRQQVELMERMERLEAVSEFFAWMVNPASRLMVRRTEYEAIREIMVQDAAAKAKQIEDLSTQYWDMKRQYTSVQEDLVHLRSECRALQQQVKKEFVATANHVRDALSDCVARIESDILDHREDIAQCGVHLNRALEEARLRSVQLAKTTLQAADKVTGMMQVTHNAMHSRIPLRIRKQLSRLEHGDLMLMLDTLSFDESTLKYLQSRFPPPPDDPFRVDDL